MNSIQKQKGDIITSLPQDNSQLSYKEKSIADILYPQISQIPLQNPQMTSQTSYQVPQIPLQNPQMTSQPAYQVPQMIQNIQQDSKKFFSSFKEVIVATSIFLVLNLPMVDSLIQKIFKTENTYYKLVIKSVIFSLLFFIITNFALSRTSQQ